MFDIRSRVLSAARWVSILPLPRVVRAAESGTGKPMRSSACRRAWTFGRVWIRRARSRRCSEHDLGTHIDGIAAVAALVGADLVVGGPVHIVEHQPRPVVQIPVNAEGPGIALADMTSIWTEIVARKKYLDLTGNGLNHPNDFGHRLYAGVILATIGGKP